MLRFVCDHGLLTVDGMCVCFISLVRVHAVVVVLEASSLYKSLGAMLTLEWFVPSVAVLVTGESTSLRKPLGTQFTLEWLLSGVHEHMSSQTVGGNEAFATLLTLKWPFASVG